MAKISQEVQDMFSALRHALGAPVVSVELTDEQLCDLLKIAIEDYSERTLNEVIANNWMGFYGKNIATLKNFLWLLWLEASI